MPDMESGGGYDNLPGRQHWQYERGHVDNRERRPPPNPPTMTHGERGVDHAIFSELTAREILRLSILIHSGSETRCEITQAGQIALLCCTQVAQLPKRSTGLPACPCPAVRPGRGLRAYIPIPAGGNNFHRLPYAPRGHPLWSMLTPSRQINQRLLYI